MGKENILASAATSASYNMILQLIFKVLTFGLNAVILRYISREMLGVVNVRLTLLYSTVLFVTREAFRRVCLSQDGQRKWPEVINLLWCTFPLAIVCASVFGCIWIYLLEQPNDVIVPYYRFGVVCFAFSTIIEMIAEPLWVVGQSFLFVKLRVVIEGLSLAVRCILTVCLVVWFPELGLISFSIAQLIFTLTYAVLYYVYFVLYINNVDVGEHFPFKSVRDFFPTHKKGATWTSQKLVALVWSFFKQSILKQLLTEGEKYIMTIFGVLSWADQGVFDVISNLGSLAARFIFLPIEDSGYLFFSQTLHRGVSAKAQESNESFILATDVLKALLKIVSIIGLIFLVFGYSYSYLLLNIYGGTMLSTGTGPTLLRWYCFYVLVIAINGTTECFVFAAMSKDDVDKFNKKMIVFSIIFLVSSLFFTSNVGSVGFIIANCLNMLARICHSIYYINKFYRETKYTPLQGAVPSLPVFLGFAGALLLTAASEYIFCCDQGRLYKVIHVGIGTVCLTVCIFVIYISEHDLILFVRSQYKNRHIKTEN